MGHKIRPDSYRLGITKDWDIKWLSRKNMAAWLEEDEKVRDIIMKKIGLAGVAKIEIERLSDRYKILIKASRPGLIIGRGGKGIEDLSKAIEKVIKSKVGLSLNVEELKRTELSAKVAAQNMAWDIEKRTAVQEGDEEVLGVILPAPRSAGRQSADCRTSKWQRDREDGVARQGQVAFIYAEGQCRLRNRHSFLHVRCDRHKGVDIQG